MAKKKFYEYRESTSTQWRENTEKAKTHKLKPNDRWRYNPREIYDSLDEEDEYDDEENYENK